MSVCSFSRFEMAIPTSNGSYGNRYWRFAMSWSPEYQTHRVGEFGGGILSPDVARISGEMGKSASGSKLRMQDAGVRYFGLEAAGVEFPDFARISVRFFFRWKWPFWHLMGCRVFVTGDFYVGTAGNPDKSRGGRGGRLATFCHRCRPGSRKRKAGSGFRLRIPDSGILAFGVKKVGVNFATSP